MAGERDNPSGKIRKVNTGVKRASSSNNSRAKSSSFDSTRRYSSSIKDNRRSSINKNVKRSSSIKNTSSPDENKRSFSNRSKSSDSIRRRNINTSSGNNYSDGYKIKEGSRASKRAKQRQKRRKKIKRIIAFVLILALIYPIFSAFSFMKKMSEAYDPSLVGGVFDNITHINKKGVTNILLLGSDAREGENDSRTDAMMIFTIDTVHNSLKLTSLARDAYVDIPGHGKTKLTHAYFYGGVELLTETIEDNFGIDIHNYALVDFESFMYIIDAVGGVSVEVKDSELDELNKFIPETYKWYKGDKTEMQLVENSGYQVLNGYQALSFARIRKNDSAFERDRRQRDVMQAMLTGIKSMSWFEYPKLINAVLPYLKTNMKSTQIVSLGISVVRMGNLDIKQFEFPITNSPHSIEGIYGKAGWVIQFDDESVKILQDFIFEDIEYTGE